VNHRPRKRFGQNFLVDEAVISRILAAIAPAPGQLIIEIGPGREALTRPLADSGAELVVVEIDRDLAATLSGRSPGFRVVNADALSVDFVELAAGRPYRLVGNLPYNISTPLLFHVLDQLPPPRDMHFMLQKEVVARMSAGPGGGDYGRLTLGCQNLCEVTALFNIGPDAFDPPPRVDSSVVRLVPRPAPRVSPELRPVFEKVVAQAFSMRRKTLRNALRPLMDADAIEAAGLDPGVRPEQVDLAGYARLAASQYDGDTRHE
jgi:16S rRNA (adenine1518-N6/adenine1519-N6)-dimethyltransferase